MPKPVFKFIRYDTKKYNFAEILAEDILQVKDLSRYHEDFLRRENRPPGSTITYEDNRNQRDRLKNRKIMGRFYKLYHNFIWNYISAFFGGKINYSSHPYFRVQMAHSTSVSSWHKDTQVTGRHDQITLWMPFVDCSGTNTIWVEQEYDKEDYVPIPVKHGEILVYDSSYLNHGSVENTTDITRVSMDFRLTMLSEKADSNEYNVLKYRPKGVKIP